MRDNLPAIQMFLFVTFLIAASVFDLNWRIIPDFLCSLIFLTGLLTFTPVKLFGILLALPLLAAALIKEGGMGGGDIKLTAAGGFVLGLPIGCVGLIIGLSSVIMWYLARKGIGKRKQIPIQATEIQTLPLAPFLSSGFIAAIIINIGGSLI